MISVVFSTFNGEITLPIMLNAMLDLEEPEGGWELIVVNNNSTDNTEKILNSFQHKLPLKNYRENKKGKNYALNSVLMHIHGDIAVFTDDDIAPPKDWLKKIREIADKKSEYSVFGGKIEPYWMSTPKPWNIQWINQAIVYGITPDDLMSGETVAGNIWGANMAIRSDIFQKGYLFDASIGPDGSNTYKMGSETSFTRKLAQDGFRCWYEKNWIVRHIIKPSQMDCDWVLLRATRFGRGVAPRVLAQAKSNQVKLLFGIPRYWFNIMLTRYLRLISSSLFGYPEETFKIKWKINYFKGLFYEAYKISRYR